MKDIKVPYKYEFLMYN